MKMKKFKKDILNALTGIIIMIISVSVVMLTSWFYDKNHNESDNKYDDVNLSEKEENQKKESDEQTIEVWYNDINFEKYFETLAKEYKKECGISVNVRFVSDMEYIETIYKANKEDGSVEFKKPDVYLLCSEYLEAAYGYGLAKVVEDKNINEENFTRNSLKNAVYKGKFIAYPFAYDTAFILYNNDYMPKVPESFDEIADYIRNFDYTVNSSVKQAFYYNVSDTMHNYCFLGSYLNFGGNYGDDETIIDIENENVKKAVSYYTEFSKVCGIDGNDDGLDEVPEKFAAGEIACTIVSMKEFNKIKELTENTGLKYSACVIPKLNNELSSKGLSLTYLLAVNYMSDKENMASDFVRYAVLKRSDLIYENTGYFPAKHIDYMNQCYAVIQEQYESSASLPKMLISADYYVLIGEIFDKAWQGEGIDDLLHRISENYVKRID